MFKKLQTEVCPRIGTPATHKNFQEKYNSSILITAYFTMATALHAAQCVQTRTVRVAAKTSKPCQPLRAQTMAFTIRMPLDSQRSAEISAQRATVCAKAYQGGPKGGDNQNVEEYEEDDSFQERVVQVRRVTKVVKGGKQLRFRATVSFTPYSSVVACKCARWR